MRTLGLLLDGVGVGVVIASLAAVSGDGVTLKSLGPSGVDSVISNELGYAEQG